jgi:hypothetical protein
MLGRVAARLWAGKLVARPVTFAVLRTVHAVK